MELPVFLCFVEAGEAVRNAKKRWHRTRIGRKTDNTRQPLVARDIGVDIELWSLRRFGGDFSGGKVCVLINKA